LEDAAPGASIAVNGCCLTVVDLIPANGTPASWVTHAQPETLARTTVADLAAGDPVNLERPLRLTDRLGGHPVQGHVDGVGTVLARRPESDGSVRVRVGAPADVLRYIVEKGSITVDGVSLTVTTVATSPDPAFEVALIPHTLEVTTLGRRGVGDR